MLCGLILGIILGVGIQPLAHFLWDIFWVWLFPQARGGVMGGVESSVIRGAVILILTIVVGWLLYKWEGKKNKRLIDAENERHNKLLEATTSANEKQTETIVKAIQLIGGQNGKQSSSD